jgi:hypothetical protein
LEERNACRRLVGKREGRDRLDDQRVDGRITLEVRPK